MDSFNTLDIVQCYFVCSYCVGILKDDLTLKEAKVTGGIKMMIIGSTINDVIAVQAPDPSEMKQSQVEETGM